MVFGANGGIGNALVHAISKRHPDGHIYAAARRQPETLPENAEFIELELTDEKSIRKAAAACTAAHGLDLIVVATGMLHQSPDLMPEKTWNEIDPAAFSRSFEINCTAPALVAKHFLPLLAQERRSVFAALGARVGSISDNRLGGWYAYRAAKAALAMVLRSLAIELKRRNPHALCFGLHPGTVDTPLSTPFQSRVPTNQLFSAKRSAGSLLDVISAARPEDSGSVLAWDGTFIPP